MKRFLILFVSFALTATLTSVAQQDSLISFFTTEDSTATKDGMAPDTITRKTEITKTINFGPFSRSETFDDPNSLPNVNDLFGFLFNGIGLAIVFGFIFYLLFFGGIIFLLVYFIKSNRRRDKERQELILKFIESGQPIPEFLNRDNNSTARYRKNGIMWLVIGAGLYVIIGELAAIPIAVGIAYLILYRGEKGTSKNKPDEQG